MRAATLTILILTCAACGGPTTPPSSDAGAAPDASTAAPPATGTDTMSPERDAEWQIIEEITRQFYKGDLDALYRRFSPGMQQEWTLETLNEFRETTLSTYGRETETVAGKREEREGYRAFKRAVRFSDHDGLVEIAWVLNADDQVAGLFITPDRRTP